MNLNNTNYREIYRYLGYGKNTPDNSTQKLIEGCVAELKEVANPKSIWQIFNLEIIPHDNILQFVDMTVSSRNLTKNLTGCHQVILFAATLGSQVDVLLKRYSLLQVSKAVVMQAAAAAMIEGYCDTLNGELKDEFKARGLYLRPRFSPGYGDFSLEHQSEILAILDAPKKIGLTLTDSYIMTPSKSVTAIIGVSETNTTCHASGCEVCEKTDCAYRRS